MKRSAFVAIFVTTNLAFILLHLHKQSQIIKLSYVKQKIELEKIQLDKQKQELTHQLQTVHDRASVKQFATHKLELKPVKIGQIRKITNISDE